MNNRAHILAHGLRGVEWSNYRHPLPEHAHDVCYNIRQILDFSRVSVRFLKRQVAAAQKSYLSSRTIFTA